MKNCVIWSVIFILVGLTICHDQADAGRRWRRRRVPSPTCSPSYVPVAQFGYCPIELAPGSTTCTAGSGGMELWLCSKCKWDAATSQWQPMGMATQNLACGATASPHGCEKIGDPTDCHPTGNCPHCDVASSRICANGQDLRDSESHFNDKLQVGLKAALSPDYLQSKSDEPIGSGHTYSLKYLGIAKYGPKKVRLAHVVIKSSQGTIVDQQFLGWEIPGTTTPDIGHGVVKITGKGAIHSVKSNKHIRTFHVITVP